MRKNLFTKLIIIGIAVCLGIIGLFGIACYFYFQKYVKILFDGGDWASICIGTVTAVSTLILGYISYWQNQQQREDNKQEQSRMQARYEDEKEEIVNEHRLDVLRQNLNNYRKQLYELDLMLLEKNPSVGLLEYNEVIAEIYSTKSITEELRQNLIKFDRWVVHTIKFLNFIYNTIVYTLYYVDKLDNCAISIVRLRHHYERMSTKFFWKWIHNPEQVIDGIQNIDEFQEGMKKLLQLSIECESLFAIYKQAALDHFQRIEYKNDVRTFFDWFDKSNEKVGILRKEVSKMEKEFEKEKDEL